MANEPREACAVPCQQGKEGQCRQKHQHVRDVTSAPGKMPDKGIHAGMRPCAHRYGATDEGELHKQDAAQFLRPEKGLVECVAGEDLYGHQHGHACHGGDEPKPCRTVRLFAGRIQKTGSQPQGAHDQPLLVGRGRGLAG